MGSQEVWDLAKNFFELKGDQGEDRATFVSLSELWCILAPPSIKPEESDFVVDSAEQEEFDCSRTGTVTVSRNHTKVITADGEVQTNEEATVYVKD